MNDVIINKQYGACIRIEEYEEIKEALIYPGSVQRKVKIYKSTTVDPETGKVIREFDSPTYVKYEFESAMQAGRKARELHDNGVYFTVEEIMDGRSGSNSPMRLPAKTMAAFLAGFKEAENG